MLAALLGMTILARRLFGSMGKWLPLALLGIANLAFNYRSMFGIAMAAVAFGMLKDVIDLRPQLRAKITPAFFVVLVGGGLAFSQGMIAVYETAADNGWLGLEARDKYLAQTSGDLSLLQSGRAESLVSTQAIADSPIIGHGSWAKDYTYVSTFIAILESKGFEIQGDPYASPLIPEHSFLLGAWVNAGIMGGVFWLAVIGTAMKALYVTLKRKESPATFVGFILFSLLWDVMFSPFGAAQRFLAASKICVALWALRGQTSAKVPSRRAGAKHLQ
jgi:O-antigen ligase